MSIKSAIPIGSIEMELAQLWEKQKTNNVLKACLFNLIIYSHTPKRIQYFQKIIQSMVEKFPCRILFIQGDLQQKEEDLKVFVSNACFARGEMSVACDQITIQATAATYHQVPFIVIPHLIPDLPIYLAWDQDPTAENEILPPLIRVATRLIFDSECASRLQPFSQNLVKLVSHLDCEIMDMNWARTSGWREVLMKVFNIPERLKSLQHAKRIVITYNDAPDDFFHHRKWQSFYIMAWLATQLNWQFMETVDSKGTQVYRFKNKKEVEFVFQGEIQNKVESGSILNIDLTTHEGEDYSLNRKQNKVFVRIAYQEICYAPFSFNLPNIQRSYAFIREMFYQHAGMHYRNMLKTLSHITIKE